MLEARSFAYYKAHADHMLGKPLEHPELIEDPKILIKTAMARLRGDGVVIRTEGKSMQRVFLVSQDRGHVWRITDQEVEVVDGEVESTGDLSRGFLIEGLTVLNVEEVTDEDLNRAEETNTPPTGEEVSLPAVLAYIDLPRSESFGRLLEIGVSIHPVTLRDTAEELAKAEVTDEGYFNRMMGIELTMQALHNSDDKENLENVSES